MRKFLRTIFLFVAALMMLFAAFVTTTVSVPHLREDLVEINVRLTLLGAVMLGLHFGSVAMFGFAAVVLTLALKTWRGAAPDRILISIIAAVYGFFGIAAFIWTGSYHALGYVLIGLLLAVAVTVRSS